MSTENNSHIYFETECSSGSFTSDDDKDYYYDVDAVQNKINRTLITIDTFAGETERYKYRISFSTGYKHTDSAYEIIINHHNQTISVLKETFPFVVNPADRHYDEDVVNISSSKTDLIVIKRNVSKTIGTQISNVISAPIYRRIVKIYFDDCLEHKGNFNDLVYDYKSDTMIPRVK